MVSFPTRVIGAFIVFRYLDEDVVRDPYYMSFSDPDHWQSDPEECDEFGVPDDEIFFYCTREELESGEPFSEFEVLFYKLVRLDP